MRGKKKLLSKSILKPSVNHLQYESPVDQHVKHHIQQFLLMTATEKIKESLKRKRKRNPEVFSLWMHQQGVIKSRKIRAQKCSTNVQCLTNEHLFPKMQLRCEAERILGTQFPYRPLTRRLESRQLSAARRWVTIGSSQHNRSASLSVKTGTILSDIEC